MFSAPQRIRSTFNLADASPMALAVDPGITLDNDYYVYGTEKGISFDNLLRQYLD